MPLGLPETSVAFATDVAGEIPIANKLKHWLGDQARANDGWLTAIGAMGMDVSLLALLATFVVGPIAALPAGILMAGRVGLGVVGLLSGYTSALGLGKYVVDKVRSVLP